MASSFHAVALLAAALGAPPVADRPGKPPGPMGEPDVVLRVTCASDAVKTAVEARRGELLACYDEERTKRREAFSATSIFEFTVQADGRVANPATDPESAESEDPALRDCVLARIGRWTFSRPAGGSVPVMLVASFSMKPGLSGEGGLGIRGTASIDREAIRKVVQAHAQEIRTCYEQRLAAAPKLAGKVLLRWVVTERGAAERVMVADGTTLEDHELHECMRAHVATWKFPPPVNGGVAIITYPWIFQSQSSP